MKHFMDCCTITFNEDKNCFIKLPREWITKRRLDGQSTLEILRASDDRSSFISWVGDVSAGEDAEVGRRFGVALGLLEGEVVHLKEVASIPPIRELMVQPDSPDDWEILELNALHLEWEILNQVRVVWTGAKLPIWVHQIPVNITVNSVEPMVVCGMLDNQTEVVILQDFPSNNEALFPVERELEPLKCEEHEYFHEVPEEPVFKFTLEKDRSCPTCKELYTEEEFNWAIKEKMLSGSSELDHSAMMGSVLGLHCLPRGMECRQREGSALAALRIQDNISQELRVLPLDFQLLRTFQRSCQLDVYLHHPNVIYVSKKTSAYMLKRQTVCRFLCRLKKLCENADEGSTVMVMAVEDDIPVPFQQVWIPDGLRLLLDLEIGCRVIVETLPDYKPASLHNIVIHARRCQSKELHADLVRGSAMQWLTHVCNCEVPLLLAPYNLVTLRVNDKIVRLALEAPTEGALVCPGIQGTVLSEDETAQAFENLKIMEKTTSDLDNPLYSEHANLFRFPSVIMKEALEFVRMSLGLSTTLWKLMSNDESYVCGNLLITGSRKSGKSSLARDVCEQLKVAPSYVYCCIVDCGRLKGKKPESIKKHLESKMEEAFEHEPSLLVLDSLDFLASVVSGPESEGTEEAVYKQRVAEIVKDAVQVEPSYGVRVCVLATCNGSDTLHPLLIAANVFNCMLIIPPPDVNEREEFMKGIVNNKGFSIEPEVLQSAAAKTNSFVVGDLETLINRAIHNYWTAEDTDKYLNSEHLECALNGLEPWSMIGGQFYEPEEKTWNHVGGLEEGKRILTQVLMWPTLYEDLFKRCPVNMNRGILLYGPPGSGKTLLARVAASQCLLKVIIIKGPELLSKYIGASEQAVREVFQRARSTKPCLIFFDEFDSLAPRRGHDSTGVTDRVVNQLLTELDGVQGSEGVYILAATSRPDLIDPALLRPGRIDKRIYCPLPNEEERAEILKCLSMDIRVGDDVDLSIIANHCQYYTGADLQAVVYDAHLAALQPRLNQSAGSSSTSHGPVEVQQRHFLEALQTAKASMSASERNYFLNIYEQFQSSKRSKTSKIRKQRATLA